MTPAVSPDLVLLDTNLHFNFMDEGAEFALFRSRLAAEGLTAGESAVNLCELIARYFHDRRPVVKPLRFSQKHVGICLPPPATFVTNWVRRQLGLTPVGCPVDWPRLRDELLYPGTAAARKQEIVHAAKAALEGEKLLSAAGHDGEARGSGTGAGELLLAWLGVPRRDIEALARLRPLTEYGYIRVLTEYGDRLRRQYDRGFTRDPNDREDFLLLSYLPAVRYLVTNDNRAASRAKRAVRGTGFEGVVLRKQEFLKGVGLCRKPQ